MIIRARRSDNVYAEVALLEFLYQGIEAEIKYDDYIPEGQLYIIDPKNLIFKPNMKWSWDA